MAPQLLNQFELTEKWNRVVDIIDCSHALAWSSHLYRIGTPLWTTLTETAAVSHSPKQGLQFIFNPQFMSGLTDVQIAFVALHEACHIMLGHCHKVNWIRDHHRWNIACDIVINEMLLRMPTFGDEGRSLQSASFRPQLLANNGLPPGDYTAEQVYGLLGETNLSKKNTLDDHKFGEDSAGAIGEAIDKLLEDPTFRNQVDEFLRAGNTSLGNEFLVPSKAQNLDKEKYPVEQWFKDAVRTVMGERTNEVWGPMNPRIAAFWPDTYLPVEAVSSGLKYRLRVYMDTSGSIVSARYRGGYDLLERFSLVLETVPTNHFEMEVFTFDTGWKVDRPSMGVYPLTKDRNGKFVFRGGGGTCFKQLERHCLSGLRYPDCIMVLTDGMGSPVEVKYPNRWVWLLTRKPYLQLPGKVINLPVPKPRQRR